jgi:hypothetical protein
LAYQFSKFSEPDPESGYTLDDNARALINMVMYHKFKPNEETLSLAHTYLRYIEGIQRPNGWFDNYKDYDNELTAQNYEVNLEDANGRALWSLGTTLAHKKTLPIEIVASKKCWDKAIVRR